MPKMKAAIFVEPGRIVLDEKPIPDVGPLDALIRITTTTICGTDVHILKGEYPVARGLTIGHEPVGVIEKLGSAVQGYREGQRVIAGAITPSGHSEACLCGCHSQDGAGTKHGWKPLGGWRFGNTIDGCQAEYVLVPDAMANLAPVPDGLTDEQVLMCPDIMSTGFSGAESGRIRIGDTVAVFAQGPIGLCATAGARLMGATTIIAVESVPERMEMARRMGADHRRRLHQGRSGRGDPAPHRRPRASTSPSRRSGGRRPSRRRCACSVRAARCRRSASTRATSGSRSTASWQDWATIPSGRRSAPAARSACGGSWTPSRRGGSTRVPL